MAGIHAIFLADALTGILLRGVDERVALARYHERRNEHGLEPFRETVLYAADLRQLSGAT